MIPKPRRVAEDNIDSWLMSYADMITLLLCFFIIFVSVSVPKQDKITEIADGMSGKFGAVMHTTPFKDAVNSMRLVVEKNELYRDVAIENSISGMAMELASGKFFKQGSAEFDVTNKPALDELISILRKSDLVNFSIIIESHTDDSATGNGLYPTNWELSAARAAKIARMMVDAGFPPAQLQAIGLAESHPKVPNRDKDGNVIARNQETNQRVVIRLSRLQ